MNGTPAIVSIVFLVGALVLAFYNMKGRAVPPKKVIKLALIWLVIIVWSVLILRLLMPA